MIWTQEKVQFLRDNAYKTKPDKLTKLFNKRFKIKKTVGSIKSALMYYHIKTGLKQFFTPVMIDWLKKNAKKNTWDQLTILFNERFKTHRSISQIRSAAQTYNIKIGFVYKSGPSHSYIGAYFIDGRGTVIEKVSCTGISAKDWRPKHIVEWEKVNGPVPKGQYIIFADGNRFNFDPDNLLLVSHSELLSLYRNGLVFRDTEMTKTGLAIVKHRAVIKERMKEIR